MSRERKNQENDDFLKKVAEKFGGMKKSMYLCTRNSELHRLQTLK